MLADDYSINSLQQKIESQNRSSGECYRCYTQTSRKCSACQRDWYCSEGCQKEMSMHHLFNCAIGRPINSADRLYLAIESDTLPDDPDTMRHFGFAYLTSGEDQSFLLGLYKGLMYLQVSNDTIHQWRLEGSLESNIIKTYETLPEEMRGGYFPWFLSNKHVLRQPKDKPAEEIFQNWFDEARKHLSPEDRDKLPDELLPTAKRESFLFYALCLHHYHPRPNEELWYTFGFCVCRDEYRQGMLGGVYQRLLGVPSRSADLTETAQIRPCTFEEFWKAHESGKLIQLMDAAGLKKERQDVELPLFHDTTVGQESESLLERYLVEPRIRRRSVWYLKGFVEEESVGTEKPLLQQSVLIDYGFANCKTKLDEHELKTAYSRLFKVSDPLELHDACIKGQIFEYARRHIKLEARYRRLMENIYPLKIY